MHHFVEYDTDASTQIEPCWTVSNKTYQGDTKAPNIRSNIVTSTKVFRIYAFRLNKQTTIKVQTTLNNTVILSCT